MNIFLKENFHKEKYFWRCVRWQIFLYTQCVARLQAGTVKEKKTNAIFVSILLWRKGFPPTGVPIALSTPAALLENQWTIHGNTAYCDMDKWHFDVRSKEVHDQRLRSFGKNPDFAWLKLNIHSLPKPLNSYNGNSIPQRKVNRVTLTC